MKNIAQCIRLLTFTICLFWCCLSINAKEYTGKILKGNDTSIRYIGRTQEHLDGSVSFDWVGTYLETTFTGGTLSVRLSETGTSYYNVHVDGELYRVVKACGIDTLINFVSGVDQKPHSLRIQKRTEGEFGKTTIHNFLLSPSGVLKEAPKVRNRHIEFIGNSLTCGFGTEGKDRNESFRLETENCDLSFSAIIARYFNADYTLIAHSGRGAVRNYGDSVRVSMNTMKDKMLCTFDENPDILWNFSTYHPDLVVVNLGTNDFSLEPQPYKSEFVKAYTQILKQLRQYYGDIPVVCIYSSTITAPVYSFFEEAVTDMKDEKIHLLHIKEGIMNMTTDLGSVWHPNYNGQRKIAMSLIPYISTIMNWDLLDKIVK